MVPARVGERTPRRRATAAGRKPLARAACPTYNTVCRSRPTPFAAGASRRAPMRSLLDAETKEALDPLNLDQWSFYVLAARVLDERVPEQKAITAGGLLHLGAIECAYGELAQVVEQASEGLQAL